MAISIRELHEIENLRSSWLCPFCGVEAKNNRICKCGAALYGMGKGRFVAKKDGGGLLSSMEADEAQLKFNSTRNK